MHTPNKFFFKSGDLSRIFISAISLFSERIFRMGLGLAISASVIRYLGPNYFGQISYALAFLALFQVIASLGFDGIVVRDLTVIGNPESGELLGTIFLTRIIVGFLSWVFAVGFIGFCNNFSGEIILLVILAGGTLVFQAGDTFDLWFQSQGFNKLASGLRVFVSLISAGFKVLCIVYHAPKVFFAAAVSFDALILGFSYWVAYQRYPAGKLKFSMPLLRRIVTEGWPLSISAISIVIYMRIDQLMIKEYLGYESVGIFSAILPLATAWQIIPMSLRMVLAPYLTQARLESKKDYDNLLSWIFWTFSLLGWISGILTFIFSDEIIHILFGQKYEGAGAILGIYTFTNIFINLGIAQSLWAINERLPKVMLYSVVIGSVVSVVGNICLLPILGLKGAVITAIIAMALSAVMLNIFFSKKIFILQVKSIFLVKGSFSS
jgi:PST family polysaccharide transporter